MTVIKGKPKMKVYMVLNQEPYEPTGLPSEAYLTREAANKELQRIKDSFRARHEHSIQAEGLDVDEYIEDNFEHWGVVSFDIKEED